MPEKQGSRSAWTYLFLPVLAMSIGLMLSCRVSAQLLHDGNKVVLERNGAAEFVYWELPDTVQLWGSELGQVTALLQFRDSLRMVLGAERFMDTIEKERRQDLDPALIAKETNGDKVNALLVHTGRVGKVRPMNQLEAQLLNYQITKYPFLSHPTEFHAFMVLSPLEDTIRVYYAASDQPWPPKPKPLIEAIEKDIASGWRLVRHLHDHFEPADRDHLGILAPSLPDAQYYKWLAEDFGLEKACITNGMHTVEIDRSEFDTFESH